MKKNMLIVEDDLQISRTIKQYLVHDEWHVDCICDGSAINRELFRLNQYGMVILDLMLPKVSGESLCDFIKKTMEIPVIVISAKYAEKDKLNLFNMGADDYMVKPFSIKELIARIHTVFRRYQTKVNENDILTFDDGMLVIDTSNRTVTVNNEQVELTPTEFKLLSLMADNPTQAFPRNTLVNCVLNYRYSGDGRVIDAHIKNLRRKLNACSTSHSYIQTVKGYGYRLDAFMDKDHAYAK